MITNLHVSLIILLPNSLLYNFCISFPVKQRIIDCTSGVIWSFGLTCSEAISEGITCHSDTPHSIYNADTISAGNYTYAQHWHNCMYCLPIQILGPSPNGKYVKWCRSFTRSSLKFSGLYFSGSGKYLASRWIAYAGIMILIPSSMKWSVSGIR